MPFDTESAAEIERADLSVGRVDEVLALDAEGVYAVASGPPPMGEGRGAAHIFLDAVRDFAEGLRRAVDTYGGSKEAWGRIQVVFQGVFEQASETIRAAYTGATPDTSGTVLVVGAEVAAVAHIGHTRAYILRGGEVVRLTRDDRDAGGGAQQAADRTRMAVSAGSERGSQAMGQKGPLRVEAVRFRLAPDSAIMLVSEGVADTLRGRDLLQTLGIIPSVAGIAGAITKAAAQRQSVADSSAVVVGIAAAGRPLTLTPPQSGRPAGQQDRLPRQSRQPRQPQPGQAPPAPQAPPQQAASAQTPNQAREQELARRDVELLGGAALFADLSPDLLGRLRGAMDEITLPKGDLMYARGESSCRLYMVTHGGLEAVREGTRLAKLPVGQLTGEATLYAKASSSVWVRATADTRVLELPLDRLESLADTDPALAAPIFRALARRNAARAARARQQKRS
ncbi:MAG: cyclic nucleotide-binding domain-containing protein [Myxococcota bacterium]